MSFNSNIPQPTDLISVSQSDLLNNMNSLQNTFTTDHFGFNPVTNLGFHKNITLTDLATLTPPIPYPSPNAGFGAIYAKTTLNQTYPQYKRDGTGTIYSLMPIKAYTVFTAANPPVSLFTLPYGNIASIVRLSGGVYMVTFVDPFPNTNYSALCGQEGKTATLVQVLNSSKLVGSCQIITFPTNGSANADNNFNVTVAFVS